MDNQKQTQAAVDERIAKAIARRAGASSSETFPVIIEQGSEPIRNRVAPNQIDSTVRFSEWKEPEREKGYKPADQKNVDPVEPKPEEIITIGNVVIQPNKIAGTFEGKFTPGGNAKHEVLLNGVKVHGDLSVSTIYYALRAQKEGK